MCVRVWRTENRIPVYGFQDSQFRNPEPAYDITAAKSSELDAAAEFGSTEARAELSRHKAARLTN
jgi:hypothetical protein